MLDIGIKLVSDKHGDPIYCKICNERMINNHDDSTTFYPTHIGIVPQSWCPTCGRMWPLVELRDPDFASNSRKELWAYRCAIAYRRGLKEFKNVVKNKLRDIDDKTWFISRFAVETGLSVEQVLQCCT